MIIEIITNHNKTGKTLRYCLVWPPKQVEFDTCFFLAQLFRNLHEIIKLQQGLHKPSITTCHCICKKTSPYNVHRFFQVWFWQVNCYMSQPGCSGDKIIPKSVLFLPDLMMVVKVLLICFLSGCIVLVYSIFLCNSFFETYNFCYCHWTSNYFMFFIKVMPKFDLFIPSC